jgi:hypothetical protein
MNKLLIVLLVAISFVACKSKKLDSTRAYFSIVDYLKAEVKNMDTMPLHFTKITTVDSTSDTSKITRDEFHKYAQEFLNIPDIASPDKMDDYTESNDFDELLNNVLLMYSGKKEDDVVKNETVMMQPDESGNTHVKTLLIHTLDHENDTAVEKEMTWHIEERFQIVTKTRKPNQPEKITTVAISWE